MVLGRQRNGVCRLGFRHYDGAMRSLRTKIIGAFLIPTLAIILLYGLLTYFASRQGLEDELGKRLVSIGQSVAAQMSDGVDAEQISRLGEDNTRVIARIREKLEKVRGATDVARLFVFDRELKSLIDTDDSVAFGQTLHAQAADNLELDRVFTEGATKTSVLFSGPDGTLYKTGYAPIYVENDVVAVVGVEASAGYFDLLTNLASVLTVLGALGLLLVVLVGSLVARKITQPVRKLMGSAQNLGKGDYTTPIPAVTGVSRDEISVLGESFEEMRREILGRDRQTQMMLSGIAHEVRNPLGGMKLFVGLLREDLEGRTEEIDKIQKIERELNYLDRVVTDFLDFARHQAPELERFRAVELLAEVDSLMSAECADAGARMMLSVEPEDLELTADRQKLRRALINCVRNAYQACLENPVKIQISVTAPRDGWRRISIDDTGPGIPEHVMDEILTPFFTTKEKGSGLGLSLTQKIMEQHGGTMHIASEVGEGTTITFELPFDPQIESAQTVPDGWLG